MTPAQRQHEPSTDTHSSFRTTAFGHDDGPIAVEELLFDPRLPVMPADQDLRVEEHLE
jgi:hypothetical protein